MNSGYKQAITLVRSELNYVNNQAGLKSIKDSGGQEYRFIATLDRRTSENVGNLIILFIKLMKVFQEVICHLCIHVAGPQFQ